MLVLTVLIFFMLSVVSAGEENSTFTYNTAAQCKEFVCRHGYKYDTFFSVESVKKSTDPNVFFEMHIAILAPSNGHIVLSLQPNPRITDPVYEIVIGGGGNKFTELRKNLGRNAKASNRTINILSPYEFRPFYIRITEGTIELGRYSDPLPILTYFDVSPIPIKYFSFAAWNDVEAKFRFDCPFPTANTSEPSITSKPITRNLSNTEILKQNLLLGRLPYIAPATTNVRFGANIKHLRFDHLDGVLTTTIDILLIWEDDSMAWNPDKFFQIRFMRFSEGQIWQPKLFASNSDSITPFAVKQSFQPVMMLFSGEAIYQFETEVKTYCADSINTYSTWPSDEYRCFIIIQPWESHENFKMSLIDNTLFRNGMGLDGVIIKNEWDWSAKAKAINASTWNQEMFNSYNDSSMHMCERIVIQLDLKRVGKAYIVGFYTPLLVLISFVLMSFWTEPLKLTRVWFYIGMTIFLCMGLCYIDDLVPSRRTPFILKFYITVLFGVLLALVVQIILMTSTVENWCKVRSERILYSSLLRTIFCLPQIKHCHTYETVESRSFDNDTYERNMDNVEELQSDNIEYDARTTLAECIDKAMFVIYSVTSAIMLIKASL